MNSIKSRFSGGKGIQATNKLRAIEKANAKRPGEDNAQYWLCIRNLFQKKHRKKRKFSDCVYDYAMEVPKFQEFTAGAGGDALTVAERTYANHQLRNPSGGGCKSAKKASKTVAMAQSIVAELGMLGGGGSVAAATTGSVDGLPSSTTRKNAAGRIVNLLQNPSLLLPHGY